MKRFTFFLILMGFLAPLTYGQTMDISPQRAEIFDGRYFRLLTFKRLPSAEQRRQWAAEGLQLVDYFPKNHYFAVIDEDFAAWNKVTELAAVRRVPLQMRVNQAILEGHLPAWAVEGDRWKVVVGYYRPLDPEKVRTRLEAMGFEVKQHTKEAFMVEGTIEPARVQDIIAQPFVQFVDLASPPPQLEANEYYKSGITRANVAHQASSTYNGDGLGVMVSEGRVDSLLQLTGRLVVFNTSASVSNHATTVASHMAGAAIENPSTNNNAYGATVYSENFTTNYGYYYDNYRIYYVNHSLGFGIVGSYQADTRQLDLLADSYPHMAVCFSAGNSGTATGYAPYNTFSGWGNATGTRKQNKNQFMTGATNKLGNLTSFSSRGPTYDGRIYPVVVTEGSGGTSFASPKTTGVLAVLQKIWLANHPADTTYAMRLRAIMTVSADDAIENPGPDFKTGFGMINVRRAMRVIDSNWIFYDSVDNGQTDSFSIVVPAGLNQLRVITMWPDEAASVGAPKALVNDLDAILISPAGDTFYPWVLNHYPDPDSLNQPAVRKVDTLNNAELITVDNPIAGTWKVKVTGTHVPMGPQDYYVTYEKRPQELVLTFPHDSVSLESGDPIYFYWDYYGASGTFTLKYQLDGGAWITISSSIAASSRAYQWTPPSVGAGFHQMRFMIARGAATDTSGPAFIVDNAITQADFGCKDGVIMWDSLAGISTYEIYFLDSTRMTPLTSGVTTTSTAAEITSLDPSQKHRLAVVPKNGNASGYWYSFEVPLSGATTALPFFDGFESDAVGTSGDVTLSGGWKIKQSPAGYSWKVNSGSTPSPSTGPNGAAYGSNYIYTEASIGNQPQQTTLLTSPCYSALMPQLSFYYHMYVSNVPPHKLYVDVFDTATLRWETVDSLIGRQHTSSSAPWSLRQLNLGNSLGAFRVRFRGVRPSGNNYYGDMSVDSVSLKENAVNVGVSAVDSPVSGCDLGSSESVWITIRNYGINLGAGSTIPYSVEVDGNTPCTGTLTVPAGGFVSGADTTFNSGCTGDLSSSGNHTVRAWTDLTGDDDASNDTFSVTIENRRPALGANDIFVDDFECLPDTTTQTSGTLLMSGNPASQWTYTNTNNGRLRSAYTNHTTGGNRAITLDANPSGTFSSNWMTVTLDMSAYNAATNAIELEFWWTDHGDETHTGDSIAIRGSNSDPWINVLSLAPGSQADNTWHQENINLSNALQAGGQNFSSTFQIRFSQYDNYPTSLDGITYDDIRVHELPPDVGVSAVDSPVSGCGLGVAEPVWITVHNYGAPLSAGSTVPYNIEVDGGTPCAGTWTIGAGGLASGADITFNSGCTGDFSALGGHTVKAWTNLTGDGDVANDTTTQTVTTLPTYNTFPHVEGFEGAHYWTFGGTNSSWQVGAPSGGDIDAAGEGAQSIFTDNGLDEYNNNEQSWAMSPCYDFSALAAHPIVSFLHAWELESSYDEGWLEYTTDGGATWTKAGAAGSGVNWYNDAVNDWWDATTGYNDWHVASHVLTGLAGQSNVRFRFRMSTDVSIKYEGIAVDQFSILPGGTQVFDPAARPYTGTSTAALSGSGWSKYQVAGDDVIWVDPQGQNLGNTDLKMRTEFPPLYFPSVSQYMTPRHWVVEPTTAPASNVTLRLFLTEEEWDTLRNRDANLTKGIHLLGITHYHGPNDHTLSWSDNSYTNTNKAFITPSAITVYPWNNGYGLEFDVQVMSQFGGNSGGGTNTPVPVELAWFRADRVGGDALLRWATASERGSDHFRVETATEVRDGKPVWRLLGTVKAAGESRELREYEFVDREPNKRGVRYYRIVEVDADGTTTESEVRKLFFDGEAGVVTVRPNPFADVLEVLLPPGEGTAQVQVEDVRGVTVWRSTVALDGVVQTLRVDASDLPSGVYTVRVTTASGSEIVKVVKR